MQPACHQPAPNSAASFQVLAQVIIAMLTTAERSDVTAIYILCTLGYAMKSSVQRM